MNPKRELDSSSTLLGNETSQANNEMELKTIKLDESETSGLLSPPHLSTKTNAEVISVSNWSFQSTTSLTLKDPSLKYHRDSEVTVRLPPATRRRSPSWKTNLWAKSKRHATLLLFAIFALIVLGFSIWLVYTEFISTQQVPHRLQLSPGNTITVVNILSHMNIFIVSNLLELVLDAFRKSMATRDRGARSTTFLAMCSTMAISETGQLLRLLGWHQPLYVSRLLVKTLLLFLGVVLLINPIHTVIYNQESNMPVIPVVAGLAQLNVNVLATTSLNAPTSLSIIDVYYQTFIKGILMDSSLVIGIDPVTCSGSNCTSFLLPGGLELVRLADSGPNSTLYGNSTLDTSPVAMIYEAPAYQLEYFPITEGFLFNRSTDCQTYGGVSNEAIHICITANDTQILAGWSVCPSSLFTNGSCMNTTTWTDQLDETTTLAIHKRYATTAYDLKEFSILGIEWISDPEPTSPTVIQEIVSNLTFGFSYVLSSVPPVLSTTDPNFPTEAGTFCVEYDLGWALRLYEDDYKNYAGGPQSVLQSFLTVPLQFSTTGWQMASWDTLPQDLFTTASFVASTPRALGKPWVIIVFSVGVGLIELLALYLLASVIIRERLFPKDLNWSIIDDFSKRRIRRLAQGKTVRDETVSLTNAEDDHEGRVFNATFEGRMIYITEVPPGALGRVEGA